MRNFSTLLKIHAALLIAMFFLLGSCRPCECNEDSLDNIKAFHPEDKYFKSALVSLHFVMETSPIAEVDTLFQQLVQMFALPLDASQARDGSYTGISPYDAFDFRHQVQIQIENGKIVAVDYNEVHKDGKGKEEDEAYCEEMSITGTTPAIAYPIMEQKLLDTQNLMEVDAVSGASYSLYRFRYALVLALMQSMI